MASLKEIKSRIQSVKSTQKITSAMKMISSSKLRKAQKVIENYYPYKQRISSILTNLLLADNEQIVSPYTQEHDIKRVAIIPISSNSSLCGSYNSNVEKKTATTLEKYSHLDKENILLFPIGKKIHKSVVKMGFNVADNLDEMIDKPQYKSAQLLANKMMELFRTKQIDKVELVYHHFVNRSRQLLVQETMLPISFDYVDDKKRGFKNNYILEPDSQSVLEQLIPKVIRLKLYTALLDSAASEHAARSIAMQIATDNADELLDDLNLQYNKSRQQAITSELLDIIGGSFGQ